MNIKFACSLVLGCLSGFAVAQTSQGMARIQGNTEINAVSKSATAVASGENSVAKNRIGVVKGDKSGDTKISVSVDKVTTVAKGGRKACTNIGGIVSDECK